MIFNTSLTASSLGSGMRWSLALKLLTDPDLTIAPYRVPIGSLPRTLTLFSAYCLTSALRLKTLRRDVTFPDQEDILTEEQVKVMLYGIDMIAEIIDGISISSLPEAVITLLKRQDRALYLQPR